MQIDKKKARKFLRSHRRVGLHLAIMFFLTNFVGILLGSIYGTLPYHDIPVVVISHDDPASAESFVKFISDSPTFKLKAVCEADGCGDYVKLNTERYGGMILSTWLDKPLSLAGRLVIKEGDAVKSRNVKVDRDLLLIPNVAIHQNRKHNDGYVFNAQTDMMPLYGMASAKGSLMANVAEAAGVDVKSVIGSDLYLYNRTPATI